MRYAICAIVHSFNYTNNNWLHVKRGALTNIDCTSCTRFFAYHLRGLLTLLAHMLFQELRLNTSQTGLAKAQVSTLQESLFKLAVWIKRSTRRIVIHLPD